MLGKLNSSKIQKIELNSPEKSIAEVGEERDDQLMGDSSNLFIVKELNEAALCCNFSKALGDDGFDGSVLIKNP